MADYQHRARDKLDYSRGCNWFREKLDYSRGCSLYNVSNMVAEPAAPAGHLRGSGLAEAPSHAAPMAEGEVFKGHAGLSKEPKEVAITLAMGFEATAIGAVCSRRRKLP